MLFRGEIEQEVKLSEKRRAKTGIWRSCGIVATSVCAFVLACLLLDWVLPARELPSLVQEKLLHLAAHANEYDALFIGSSRVRNQIMPAVFDRDMAAQGQAIKSFNAGVSGMYPPEDDCFLDQILRLKPARLRWVFVELQTLETTLPRAKRDTLRKLWWHDWPRFRLVGQRFITTRKHRHWRDRFAEVSSRWPEFCDHTLLFVRYFTNLGRGSALLDRWVSQQPAPPPDWDLLGDNRDGWVTAEREMKDTTAILDDALARRRRGTPPVRDFADPVSQKALASMIAKIRRAGATPVLIVPPTPNKNYFVPDPKSAEQAIVLDFTNPEKYPELFQTKYRVDLVHMNPAGAEIFTHLLAREFVEAMKPQ